MPADYTGNPAGTFDVTAIPLPVDSDEPSSALFSAPLETLLDNDAILDARATAIEGEAVEDRRAFVYTAEIQGTSVASNDYLTIDNSSINLGFSTFSALSGTALEFPDEDDFPDNDDRGVYLVTVDAYAQVAGTSDPELGQIIVRLYDATGPTLTTQFPVVGRRFSTSTGDAFAFHGSGHVDMTGLVPANSRLVLQNLSGTAITMQATQSRIVVTRVGRGSP